MSAMLMEAGGVALDPSAAVACPICLRPSTRDEIAEAGWVAPETASRLAGRHPGWQRSDGACAACVQDALLSLLREKGERVLGRVVQDVWPLDAEAAFGALPTPLRMRADPRFTGRGITIAMVDAGFYPHVDLVRPSNRIRAIVDAGAPTVGLERFAPNEVPKWTGWDAKDGARWHGLMTSAAAGGNGYASRGLYRSLAPDALLVLIQARDARGRITSESIAGALAWLYENHDSFNIRIASVSLGGDPEAMLQSSDVDAAVERLVRAGILVIAAAGNDGVRRLVPPATAPASITVGGIDDRNVFDAGARTLWRSNYGATWMGNSKPELVAPSLWVAAPVLPMTDVAREAAELFTRRAAGDPSCEARIAELKLVTPHYQHVEGTSFAAPIVAGIVACMLEANPALTPSRVRDLLTLACRRVDSAPIERQGAGVVDAGTAVALALAERIDIAYPAVSTPASGTLLRFTLHDPDVSVVRVAGSWDDWAQHVEMTRIGASVWQATIPALPSGSYAYKLVIDDTRWISDPANPRAVSDGFGGTNSTFEVR